ncbi:hypothetical protein EKO04_004202 [Ascochyta lentis]|uniref:Arrestin-like N-terminal domain-containing protein n=1 Tax=Ascochyta lentis TaxID=205686 RepID=A0A8H7J4X4_9PLEO|nr:hypothetical protein EKO04_004202 [Ascochyta lentis]
MDVQIQIEDNENIHASGDVISGQIHIFCAQATTISKLTVNLIGESTSSLTGAPGLLFSRREGEKHVFVREEHLIVPSVRSARADRLEPIRLAVGCHSFDFALRVPWVQDCSSCPPNSPIECASEFEATWSGRSSGQQLPPSTKDLQKGTEVTYRVDAIVTTLRNMFKSRITKSSPLTIWPVDKITTHDDTKPSLSSAIATARATILGPGSLPLPPHRLANDIRGLGPAEIIISATFPPEFGFTKSCPDGASLQDTRKVALNLSVTRLNDHPQDMYLQSFQMLLVGYTDIRAGATTHGQMSFWTLQSLSNIGLQVFESSDASGTQHHIDPNLWSDVELDESVVPDFSTCNLVRRYELEILMGWQCRSGEHAGRVFFVQVRTPVRISSGLSPGRLRAKGEAGLLKDDTQPSQSLRHEEPRVMHRVSYAPPTYDEAVRASVRPV